MPLPDHALTLTGGCNCGAMRYRISIPAVADRPLNPSSTAENPVTLPMLAIDHCNDCRRATGFVLPMWMCTPASMMEVRLRSSPSPAEEEGEWRPALEQLVPATDASSKGTATSSVGSPTGTVLHYHSSWDTTRSFCGRCGTHLTFARRPMPNGALDIFDVLLGTFDREFLEKDWMRPERHCWVSCQIPWVRKMVNDGVDLPAHPRSQMGESAD